jgi:hypothetical protein
LLHVKQKKTTLQSAINNQITIFAKETKDMEHRHCKQLNEKGNKIKYLKQCNYAQIQCFLKMQDSSATFSFSGDDTNSMDKGDADDQWLIIVPALH